MITGSVPATACITTRARAETPWAFAQSFDANTRAAAPSTTPEEFASLSVKLSALHSRYEFAQRRRVMEELVPRLTALAALAKGQQIGFTVDRGETRVAMLEAR